MKDMGTMEDVQIEDETINPVHAVAAGEHHVHMPKSSADTGHGQQWHGSAWESRQFKSQTPMQNFCGDLRKQRNNPLAWLSLCLFCTISIVAVILTATGTFSASSDDTTDDYQTVSRSLAASVTLDGMSSSSFGSDEVRRSFTVRECLLRG